MKSSATFVIGPTASSVISPGWAAMLRYRNSMAVLSFANEAWSQAAAATA